MRRWPSVEVISGYVSGHSPEWYVWCKWGMVTERLSALTSWSTWTVGRVCQVFYERDVSIVLRCFLRNHSNIATEGSPKSELCPTSIEWQGFFIVHSKIDSNAHSRLLNSLGHCNCTTPITNIQPGRDANPVPRVLTYNRTEIVIETVIELALSKHYTLSRCWSNVGQRRRR